MWATDSFTQSLGAGNKINRDLLANLETAGSSVLGATIMRTHSYIAVSDLWASATIGLTVGYIVDTAPTVTNLDPTTAFGDDWMLLRTLAPSYATQATTNNTILFYGQEIDLRSKRKVEEIGEKYFLCFANQGSASVTLGAFTRTLIALP